VSILIKAGAGLVAGVVAGALGLAFLPQMEPNAVSPRQAVGKPQFIVAEGSEAKAPAVAVAAVAVPPTPSAPPPKLEAKPEVVTAAAPSPVQAAPAPSQIAKADPPAPNGATRGLTLNALEPPKSTPAPLAPETRAAAPAAPSGANAAAARWSVQGLVALAKGDLSVARLYLARAAEAGDPRAFVALADTYDPAMLARLGVVGAPGDAQRAKDYLVKAAAAGVFVSKDRMAALDQAPSPVR
jgi:hypothetical protein